MEYHDYYFQVKIGLSDTRYPNKVILSTTLLDLIPDNEVQITNVQSTTHRINICGSFSNKLGPGMCFVKFGNEEWQTINFCSTIHDNLLISSQRKAPVSDNNKIRVKIIFPKLWDYTDVGKLQTIDYEELTETGYLSVEDYANDITEYSSDFLENCQRG